MKSKLLIREQEVMLEISRYAYNGNLYIGLISNKGYFANITVNLDSILPDYYGYVDTNNFSEVEKFILENELGEFTGIVEQSGFCHYPLYKFNVDKLRELCPEQIEVYEHNIPI